MCKDGKRQARADQTRNTVVSLGTAARELARLANHPHMVVKTPAFIALVLADPELISMPDVTVVMEVYPTTSDDEIQAKADRFMAEPLRSTPSLVQLLEALLGSVPAPELSDQDRATLRTMQTSAKIAERTAREGF